MSVHVCNTTYWVLSSPFYALQTVTLMAIGRALQVGARLFCLGSRRSCIPEERLDSCVGSPTASPVAVLAACRCSEGGNHGRLVLLVAIVGGCLCGNWTLYACSAAWAVDGTLMRLGRTNWRARRVPMANVHAY